MGLKERLFASYTANASEADVVSIEQNIDGMNRGPIRGLWDKVKAMWRMICDPQAAWGAKALAIGALVYLISPIDAVPDFIPGVGLLDDAAIIAAVVCKLGKALSTYMMVAGVTIAAAQKLKRAAVEAAERAAHIEVKKRLRFAAISLASGIIAAGIVIGLKLALGVESLVAVVAFRGTLICYTVYQAVLLGMSLVRFKKIYDRCPKWIARPLLRWGGRLVGKGLSDHKRLVALDVALLTWLIVMNVLAWLL